MVFISYFVFPFKNKTKISGNSKKFSKIIFSKVLESSLLKKKLKKTLNMTPKWKTNMWKTESRSQGHITYWKGTGDNP